MEKYHKFKICSFFSQVLLIGTLGPHPLAHRRVRPPLLFQRKGGWGPNSDEGIDTVVLYVYEYFVLGIRY